MPRTMHLLNSLGHVTIHWEQQNDEQVLPVIDLMLATGYKFFIVTDDTETGIPDQVAITSAADVASIRRVTLSDESLQQLYDAGLVQVGGITIEDDAETTGELAKDAATVAANETVVTQPARGG